MRAAVVSRRAAGDEERCRASMSKAAWRRLSRVSLHGDAILSLGSQSALKAA